jgi:hypothetical protein
LPCGGIFLYIYYYKITKNFINETIPASPMRTMLVYSAESCREMDGAYRGGCASELGEVDPDILASTIRFSSTRLVDVHRQLDGIRQDSRAASGTAIKKGNAPSYEEKTAETAKIRWKYYRDVLRPKLEQIDGITDQLGAAITLFADYCARTVSAYSNSATLERVLAFAPVARYVKDKVLFVEGETLVPIGEHEEYQELKGIAWIRHFSSNLLELKVAGAALQASLDKGTIDDCIARTDVPDDIISEFDDAFEITNGKLGLLQKLRTKPELRELARMADRTPWTKRTQEYATHHSSKVVAAIALPATLLTTTAALVIGVPQIAYWVMNHFDPGYTPLISPGSVQTTLLTLTSSAAAALMFIFLTVGTDLGPTMVKHARDMKWYKPVTITPENINALVWDCDD